jgi:hypothetical protein
MHWYLEEHMDLTLWVLQEYRGLQWLASEMQMGLAVADIPQSVERVGLICSWKVAVGGHWVEVQLSVTLASLDFLQPLLLDIALEANQGISLPYPDGHVQLRCQHTRYTCHKEA